MIQRISTILFAYMTTSYINVIYAYALNFSTWICKLYNWSILLFSYYTFVRVFLSFVPTVDNNSHALGNFWFRYELIKINQFRGLSLSIVQLFSKQVFRFLDMCFLHFVFLNVRIYYINCFLWCPLDLTWFGPFERCWHNPLWSEAREYPSVYQVYFLASTLFTQLKSITLIKLNSFFFSIACISVKPTEIKIIDFGSACMEDRTVYSYIQVLFLLPIYLSILLCQTKQMN